MRFVKLLLFVIGLFTALNSWALSSVWMAEKDGQRILLAGTVHMLPPDIQLPEEYIQAYEGAQRVAFETDLAALEKPEMATQMMGIFFPPEGKTLRAMLRPDTYDRLRAFAEKQGIGMASLEMFNPAFISVMMPMMIYQKQGYGPGVDEYFNGRARSAGKAIEWLETPEAQIEALKALNDVNQDDLILETLKELNDPDFSLDAMMKAMFANDNRHFDKMLQEMRTEYPSLYKQLLTQRNASWIDKIERMTADGMPTLVLVGVLHLVGEDSVLALLRQRGYQIQHFEVQP